MASITKRTGKRGVMYRATVCVNKQRVTATFDRKSDAVRWGEDTEAAIRAGGYIGDAAPGDMLFDKALERYLAEVSSQKAASTNRRDNSSGDRLIEWFKGKTLRGIIPADVAAYRDDRLTYVSASTVKKELAVLSHLYTIAEQEWGLDLGNPVSRIRKPKVAPGRIRFLSHDEISALLVECRKAKKANLYHYVLLQLHTGMRPSEGAGLKWNQVDLKNRFIDLTQTKTDPRRVPLTEFAVKVLKQLKSQCGRGKTEYVFLPEKISDRIIERPNQYFREVFESALARAKINDFTMHDLRHTTASYLIMSGVDIRTVAEILGHKDIRMTMRYTHLLDDHKLTAVDKIGDLGFE